MKKFLKPGHYWHLGPSNSLLWELRTAFMVGCLAAFLASTLWRLVSSLPSCENQEDTAKCSLQCKNHKIGKLVFLCSYHHQPSFPRIQTISVILTLKIVRKGSHISEWSLYSQFCNYRSLFITWFIYLMENNTLNVYAFAGF